MGYRSRASGSGWGNKVSGDIIFCDKLLGRGGHFPSSQVVKMSRLLILPVALSQTVYTVCIVRHFLACTVFSASGWSLESGTRQNGSQILIQMNIIHLQQVKGKGLSSDCFVLCIIDLAFKTISLVSEEVEN